MLNMQLLLGTAAFLTLAFSSSVSTSQSVPPTQSTVIGTWHSESVVYVAGAADLKQNASGSLSMTADDLVFSAGDVHAQIPLRQITSVFTGDERVATGGATAKVVRLIPVFGIGAAVGAVSNKTVDVLTVEYRDTHLGYHGAVFEVPKGQAEAARKQLMGFAMMPGA